MKRKSAEDSSAKTPVRGAKTLPPVSQRTSRGLLSVGLFTGKVTKPLLGKRGLGEGDLVARWELIVGPAVARLCAPERIRFPRGSRENGELVIRVSSGPAATQIQHDAPRILEKINSHFGYCAVVKLKMVQAPLPLRRPRQKPAPRPLTAIEEQDLSAMLAGVADPDLRATLERLGRAVRAKKAPEG